MGLKKMTVRTKLLMGFFCVVALTIFLSAFGIFTLRSVSESYGNVLNYPQERLKRILIIKSHVMDIRRITTAINAYTGNVERQEGYRTESANAVTKINSETDLFIDLVSTDSSLRGSEESDVVQKAQSLKTILAEYKTNLIDVNIESAILGDKDAVVANASKNASLISTLQSTIEELAAREEETATKMSAETEALEERYMLNFIIIAAVISVFSIVVALIISRGITKPVRETQKALTALAKGSFDVSVRGNYSGEFADMKDAMNETVSEISSYINELSDVLGDISNGNLTKAIDREYVGNFSEIKRSINLIVERLGSTMSEIRSSAVHVSTGSKQIADGAQALSQGTTEQASVVENLSLTVGEIAEKTKRNAGIAQEAAVLSEQIRGSAEKGSNQMEQMVHAVREISDASNRIEKVIKVIDDIAFQTNILALNAAVEAARAGSSGKGFAVVAEEVRNLAAKSAEAAKDTGEMIENSIGKANLGLSIATETSVSLKEIVEGINQSAELVAQIALSSNEQADAIEMVNSGIGQVAMVVQQNSAVAEESASASDEMSGQAGTLEKLTGQFLLKDGTQSRLSSAAFNRAGKTGFTPDIAAVAADYGRY